MICCKRFNFYSLYVKLFIDADEVHRRQIAMDEARRRMQEKHDQEAARFAEKQKIVCACYLLLSAVMFKNIHGATAV